MAKTSTSKKGNVQRRGLGKGLGALIVNTESATPASEEIIAQAEAGGVRMISVYAIAPNPHQPRTHFDNESLEELAASIREHGIIQPLIVTENSGEIDENTGEESRAGKESTGRESYWLVAGERRWRAAQLADLAEVPVIVRETTPQQLMEWALVENVQRADLNALEEAAAYQALMDEMALTQAQVSARVGKSRSVIANAVRLLNLTPKGQDALVSALISAAHARTLVSLYPDKKAMDRALELVLKQGLSVRQTETLVKKMAEATSPDFDKTIAPQEQQMQAHIRYLEDQFRSALGTRVNLNRNDDGSGRLVVHFYSDDDLDNIFRQIAGEQDDL